MRDSDALRNDQNRCFNGDFVVDLLRHVPGQVDPAVRTVGEVDITAVCASCQIVESDAVVVNGHPEVHPCVIALNLVSAQILSRNLRANLEHARRGQTVGVGGKSGYHVGIQKQRAVDVEPKVLAAVTAAAAMTAIMAIMAVMVVAAPAVAVPVVAALVAAAPIVAALVAPAQQPVALLSKVTRPMV